ncbi:MAG: DNA-3-methyladenine glycosylase [Candidatus Moraniibacteriota bacterium]|nr:MAG: DNA-3-methyladenine glycosylase [Candidatus Moranbacteria bacterium]
MRLPRTFYERETTIIARELLGATLTSRIDGRLIRGRIVETEAYHGEDDLACHASRGRTKRTETMYGAPGHAYVYLIYGMYHCLNVVTMSREFPAAVLIRAVSVPHVSFSEVNGPGKLCRFFGITKEENGIDMVKGDRLSIERGALVSDRCILVTPRIGIEYAKNSRDFPWRFVLKEESLPHSR